jgi:hypothetical protein
MKNSKHMKALSVAIAVASLGVAAPAIAQYAPPTQDSSQQSTMPRQSTTDESSSQAAFAQLDANHDGTIGKDEAAADAGLGAAFKSLDADGNGSLDQAEFDKYAQASQQGASDDGSSTPPSGTR